mmetsp:Transcript_7069/g.10314  ORF Transcript_7069/g.10314 Transcript_7069/m.10314 type:complete len:509 (+) Transcript_7069:93-1619(+)|eukprot:CAMPEP_0194220310 /NCGR_PEP_ID=MMETSP0156-20130528/28037_1 /TAXON_ID=33649 /ORGANISM="Thalassionema nitzschioides, Strain L26-B" /LENGTH=508 /DNA_ID=CAMNT_0038950289 /DNA_START=78 /DNA_END=1604 /DNA_ORIENTATION=-
METTSTAINDEKRTKRAIIVGGSMAGLVTAIVLLKSAKNWNLQIYEKSVGDLSLRGAGIVTIERMIADLKMLGIIHDEGESKLGAFLKKRCFYDNKGKSILYSQYTDPPQISASWANLYMLCKAKLDHMLANDENSNSDETKENDKENKFYYMGREVLGYRKDTASDKVLVTFQDNLSSGCSSNVGTVQCDLLIGCDGNMSKIRELMIDQILIELKQNGGLLWQELQDLKLGEMKEVTPRRELLTKQLEESRYPLFANYVVYRFVLSESILAQNDITGSWSEDLFSKFTFWGASNKMFMLSYPMVGYEKNCNVGERLWNTVCYVHPNEKQLRTIKERGRAGSAIGLPIDETDLLSLKKSLFDKLIPKVLSNLFIYDENTTVMCHPVTDFCMPIFTDFKHVVLVGDSACTARPHTAMGTTKAIEDAIALGESLQEAEKYRTTEISAQSDMLRRYNTIRVSASERSLQHGRKVGECIFPFCSCEVENQEDALKLLFMAVRLNAVHSSNFF